MDQKSCYVWKRGAFATLSRFLNKRELCCYNIFKESFSTSRLNKARVNAIFPVRIHKNILQCTDIKKAYSTDLTNAFSENAWKKNIWILRSIWDCCMVKRELVSYRISKYCSQYLMQWANNNIHFNRFIKRYSGNLLGSPTELLTSYISFFCHCWSTSIGMDYFLTRK